MVAKMTFVSATYVCESPWTWDFSVLYESKANCMSFKNLIVKQANDLFESKNDIDLAKKKMEIDAVNQTILKIDWLISKQMARPFR